MLVSRWLRGILNSTLLDVTPKMHVHIWDFDYQHCMAFVVHRIAGIQFISKQYNPVGGMSQGELGASHNQKFSDSLGGLWDIGVGTDKVYEINKYDIYSRGWYLPVSKRITKALNKRRKYRENITRELDMIKQHMQCGSCTTGRGGITRVDSDEIGGRR